MKVKLSKHIWEISQRKLTFKRIVVSRMSTSPSSSNVDLQPYNQPDWLRNISGIPTHRVQLSQTMTPIHRWDLPGLPDGFQVSIKRDDLTGSTLSGNKVRKLEFLFADAINKGCNHVITIGGIQSNHCRAVAVAARQLGLTPHLFLRTDIKNENEVGCEGNLLLDRMTGANIYLIPRKSSYKADGKPRMEKLAEHIKSTTGEKSYLIPLGGSDEVGIFGYIEAFNELMKQDVMARFDDIVCTCGSGSTVAGLAVANHLTGSKLRVHGLTICDNQDYFHEHSNEIFPLIGLHSVRSEDIMNLVDGFKGKGYGISTDEELEFISKVSQATGIMLDPVYTGKAAYGLMNLITNNSQIFKGRRILFIHTGGIFGLADGRMNSLLKNSHTTNQIKVWSEINSSPL